MSVATGTDVHELLRRVGEEAARSERFLHLTANEALMSDTARSFMASRLSDLYFMGGGDDEGIVDFQPFTFRGMPDLQLLVDHAESAAKEMLDAADVSLKCLSGIHAMMCAILSTTEPGDAVMTVDLEHGGHFATKHIVERTGRRHVSTAYDFDTLAFDVDELGRAFHRCGARAFYLDVSFYLNPHDLAAIREALGPDAVIIYDASHTMGLIMGQQFQAPLREGADVVSGNTHKTLPGPQKGMIAFRSAELGARANSVINSGLFSSPHTGSMIALATTILELRAFGESYAQQVVANSNALARAFAGRGHVVRKANTGRYSENHQVHVMTDHIGNYRDLYTRLRQANISVNFDRALGAGTYIRFGTQRVTRSGMREQEMAHIAELVTAAIEGRPVADRVAALVAQFPGVHYSFDKGV